jgi:hypothetical protein
MANPLQSFLFNCISKFWIPASLNISCIFVSLLVFSLKYFHKHWLNFASVSSFKGPCFSVIHNFWFKLYNIDCCFTLFLDISFHIICIMCNTWSQTQHSTVYPQAIQHLTTVAYFETYWEIICWYENICASSIISLDK